MYKYDKSKPTSVIIRGTLIQSFDRIHWQRVRIKDSKFSFKYYIN